MVENNQNEVPGQKANLNSNVQPGSVVGSAKLQSGKPQVQSGPSMQDIKGINDQLSNITRRLKLLEERITSIRSKTVMLEENIMNEKRHVDKNNKELGQQIKENKLTVSEVKDDVVLIIKELQTLAKKDKVQTLSKYIELWSPINYVSQNEVEKLIKDRVEETLKDMAIKTQQENFIEEMVEKKLRER